MYRKHFRLLVSSYRARGMGRGTAEDLAQETLVRAYASLGSFDPSRPMWPWVKAIGRRVAADHRRRPNREFPAELGEGPGIPSESALVDERSILDVARRELTRRQDLAVRLRYEEDREPRQAAATLGVSVAAFNQLLFRARQRLREEYRRLSEGAPVLVWLRWTWSRYQGLCRRLQRGISTAPWRGGDAADKIIGAGALSLCLLLIPLSPLNEAPPSAEARPLVEPPAGVGEPRDERSWLPAGPARAQRRATPVPEKVPEAGGSAGNPSVTAPPASVAAAPPVAEAAQPAPPDDEGGATPSPSHPIEPPPPEPVLSDPDPVDLEPDPEEVADEVLSHPALKDPPPPVEGIALP